MLRSRLRVLAVALLLPAVLPACGGGGGGAGGPAGVIPAKVVSNPTATPAGRPSAAPTASSGPMPTPPLAPTPTPGGMPTPIATPTPIAAPTPSSPLTIPTTHVQTATYLWSSTEAATAPTTYAPYLTWAYPLYNNMPATHQAGIKTIVYMDPVMPRPSSYEYTDLSGTYASVRATDCSGNVITTYSGTGLLADPRAPLSSAYYSDIVNWYIRNKLAPYSYTQDWDAMFVDNNGQLYGASATPCNYTPAAWGQAFDAAISGISQKFITNSLATADSRVQTYVNYLTPSNVIGGEFEECFTNGEWTAEEDSQLETVALFKSEGKAPSPAWWCFVDNSSVDGATVLPLRLFAYASFLLTYDPNYSLFQEAFSTSPSTFQVFPETGFVPLYPASVPSGIAGLQSSTGAYVQSYSACYYRGSLVGACEIVVNPTSSTVSVPNPKGLAHSMVLSGDGVLDGGSVSFSGAAASSLAPQTSAILVP